jgi:hypothetical protein
MSGLADGADAHELGAAVADLHPKNNTFPGEVLADLAADAVDVADVSRDNPIPYEVLREVYLPECAFGGRENRKIQYAILTSAAQRAGLERAKFFGGVVSRISKSRAERAKGGRGFKSPQLLRTALVPVIRRLASSPPTRLRGAGGWKPRLDPGDICHIELVIDLTTRRTGRFAYSV